MNIDQNFLEKMVSKVGRDLEAESKLIKIMKIYYNERFLQYIIFKSLSLLLNNNYDVCTELEGFDINICKENCSKKNYVALGEIKCWRSADGERELLPNGIIKTDIDKLKNQNCPGFIIILTINPRGQIEENIKYLVEKLHILDFDININDIKRHTFLVNKKREFSILGFWAKEPTPMIGSF